MNKKIKLSVSAIIIAAMLLLVSPLSAVANSRTYTINLNGRTAIYATLDEEEEGEDTLFIVVVGDLVIKLPGQKAQVVEGAAQIAIGLEGGFFGFDSMLLEDVGATFDWSMYKCVLTAPFDEGEIGIITLTAIESPTAIHNSIDLGEILGITELNLVIRTNAVMAPANVEVEPESADDIVFALIAVGTLNLAFTPPATD